MRYFEGKGIVRVEDVSETYINSYVLDMEKNGMSMATVSRNIASKYGIIIEESCFRILSIVWLSPVSLIF